MIKKDKINNRADEFTRITTKLDAETYRRLRQHGLDTAQSNQAIMVMALEEYLAWWDEA